MDPRLLEPGEILKKGFTTKTDGNGNVIVIDDPEWARESDDGSYRKARKVRSACSNFTPKKKKRKK